MKINHQDNSIKGVNGIVVTGNSVIGNAIVQQGTVQNTSEIDWEKILHEIDIIIEKTKAPHFLSMHQELVTAKQAIVSKDKGKLSTFAKRIGREGISFITALSANTLGTLLAKLLGG